MGSTRRAKVLSPTPNLWATPVAITKFMMDTREALAVAIVLIPCRKTVARIPTARCVKNRVRQRQEHRTWMNKAVLSGVNSTEFCTFALFQPFHSCEFDVNVQLREGNFEA